MTELCHSRSLEQFNFNRHHLQLQKIDSYEGAVSLLNLAHLDT
jgi:hypothetical protein